MERTLKVVQARHAIEDIIFRYADAVDGADMETVGRLLHACTVTLPGDVVLQGGNAIRDHYSRTVVFYDRDERVVPYARLACSPRTRHITSNLIYDFDPAVTTADVQSYFTVYQTLGGTSRIIAGGRYVDRFEYGISGWTMVTRRIHIDQRGDMSRHAQAAAPQGGTRV